MSVLERDHNFYMQEALKEAVKALDADEVPIGAVIVLGNRIIGRAHNQRETLKDPTAHAEIIALTQAAAALDNWRLAGATIYVTLEPCPMCAGALVNARVKTLVYGAKDPKAGACGSLFNIADDKRLNHRLEVISGVMEQDCQSVLQEFFRVKRSSHKCLGESGQ
ncbi:MAG: tRNA adenosine(34) deaminase TadA [Planctomycetes bacterium]|nr:tRNA adenosine(34) deaminase TadA [Planctomycetota bacterium]